MDDDGTHTPIDPNGDRCLTAEEARHCIETIWADDDMVKRLLAVAAKLRSEWRIHWMTADDILHEVAMKLIATDYNWPRYMSKIPSAYIMRKLNQYCREQRRTPTRNGSLEQRYFQESPDQLIDWSSERYLAANDMIRNMVEDAGLNEVERNVLWLRFLGYSNDEITQHTGLSYQAVRNSVRTLQRKARRLEIDGGDYAH